MRGLFICRCPFQRLNKRSKFGDICFLIRKRVGTGDSVESSYLKLEYLILDNRLDCCLLCCQGFDIIKTCLENYFPTLINGVVVEVVGNAPFNLIVCPRCFPVGRKYRELAGTAAVWKM